LLGGGVAICNSRTASELPTVGFLGAGTFSSWSLWTAAFIQRMRELGWIDGRTIAIEYRWAEGQYDRLPALAADLIHHKVAVIAAN
jgi:putative ABC transport system substrate-binding protein